MVGRWRGSPPAQRCQVPPESEDRRKVTDPDWENRRNSGLWPELASEAVIDEGARAAMAAVTNESTDGEDAAVGRTAAPLTSRPRPTAQRAMKAPCE